MLRKEGRWFIPWPCAFNNFQCTYNSLWLCWNGGHFQEATTHSKDGPLHSASLTWSVQHCRKLQSSSTVWQHDGWWVWRSQNPNVWSKACEDLVGEKQAQGLWGPQEEGRRAWGVSLRDPGQVDLDLHSPAPLKKLHDCLMTALGKMRSSHLKVNVQAPLWSEVKDYPYMNKRSNNKKNCCG